MIPVEQINKYMNKNVTVPLGIPWQSTAAWCCSRRWWLCQSERWWTWAARWSRAPCIQEACIQYLQGGGETDSTLLVDKPYVEQVFLVFGVWFGSVLTIGLPMVNLKVSCTVAIQVHLLAF